MQPTQVLKADWHFELRVVEISDCCLNRAYDGVLTACASSLSSISSMNFVFMTGAFGISPAVPMSCEAAVFSMQSLLVRFHLDDTYCY